MALEDQLQEIEDQGFDNQETGFFSYKRTASFLAPLLLASTVYAGCGDMDNDGDLDILSASENDDKIAWYKNSLFTGLFEINPIQSVIKDNPHIEKKFTETNPKNFSIGDLTYNLEFERIRTNDMRNLFKTHACRNKNSQDIYNSHEEVEKIIGRFDTFYNRKNNRLYCTNLYNEVKLRLQLIERSKPPPMTTPK